MGNRFHGQAAQIAADGGPRVRGGVAWIPVGFSSPSPTNETFNHSRAFFRPDCSRPSIFLGWKTQVSALCDAGCGPALPRPRHRTAISRGAKRQPAAWIRGEASWMWRTTPRCNGSSTCRQESVKIYRVYDVPSESKFRDLVFPESRAKPVARRTQQTTRSRRATWKQVRLEAS